MTPLETLLCSDAVDDDCGCATGFDCCVVVISCGVGCGKNFVMLKRKGRGGGCEIVPDCVDCSCETVTDCVGGVGSNDVDNIFDDAGYNCSSGCGCGCNICNCGGGGVGCVGAAAAAAMGSVHGGSE